MSKQISQLLPASSLGAGDQFHIQQNGLDRRASSSVVKSFTDQNAVGVPHDINNTGFVATDVQGALDEAWAYIAGVTGALIFKGAIDLTNGNASLPLNVEDGWLYTCDAATQPASPITVWDTVTGMTKDIQVAVGDQIYYGDNGLGTSYWFAVKQQFSEGAWDSVFTGNSALGVNTSYKSIGITLGGQTVEYTIADGIPLGTFFVFHHAYDSGGTMRISGLHTITGNALTVGLNDSMTIAEGRTVYMVSVGATSLQIVNNG